MKLTIFQCGSLKSKKHLFTMGKDVGVDFTVPVPFFLIEHPRGLILYDTGNALEVAQDKVKHWGAGVVGAYDPLMTEDDFVVRQLAWAGIAAERITHVILSHLHLDHAGGVGHFPKARYIVQKEEMRYAYVPDFFQRGAYIRADFDKPDLDWVLLNGPQDPRGDLFGDGRVVILPTPGHTPGHQSLLVDLPNNGRFLLTGDGAYTEEILDEDLLPGLVQNPSQAIDSINLMRHLRDQGVKVITGHDPTAFARLRRYPEFYD